MSAEASTPTNNSNARLSRIIAAGFEMPIAHNDRNAAALRAQVCMALRGLRTEHTFEEMRCENARCPTPCSQAVHMQRRGQKRPRQRHGQSCGGKGWSDHRQQHPTQGLTQWYRRRRLCPLGSGPGHLTPGRRGRGGHKSVRVFGKESPPPHPWRRPGRRERWLRMGCDAEES